MPPSAAGGGDTSEGDESVTNNKDNVKEVRLICSFLHESFIADPNLAKLVHFQVKQSSLPFSTLSQRQFNSFVILSFVLIPKSDFFQKTKRCTRSRLMVWLDYSIIRNSDPIRRPISAESAPIYYFLNSDPIRPQISAESALI